MADVVLLHPFPVDHRFWHDVVPVIGAAGHRVSAPDLPGFGSRPEEPGWTLNGEADRMARDVPRGAAVVGLSMGGYLALALARRHPGVPGALVLAHTRARGEAPGSLGERRRGAYALRASGVGEFVADFLPRAMWAGSTPRSIERLRHLAMGQSAGAMSDATMAIAGRDDQADLLPRIAVPTMVVVGEHDAITPPALSAAMAATIPGARLAVIGDAGHMTALVDASP